MSEQKGATMYLPIESIGVTYSEAMGDEGCERQESGKPRPGFFVCGYDFDLTYLRFVPPPERPINVFGPSRIEETVREMYQLPTLDRRSMLEFSNEDEEAIRRVHSRLAFLSGQGLGVGEIVKKTLVELEATQKVGDTQRLVHTMQILSAYTFPWTNNGLEPPY